TVRATRAGSGLVQRHHHAPVLDGRLEELDLLDGRQRGAARAQVEGGAVVHALDLAVQQLAVVQRVALVGAAVGEGEELAPLVDHHDLDVCHRAGGDAPFRELVHRPHVEAAYGRFAHSFSLTPGTPSLACTTRSTYSATFGSVTRLITSWRKPVTSTCSATSGLRPRLIR